MLNIFRKLHHVCVVVHDIQKATAYYESVGIGPWYGWGSFAEFPDLDVEDVQGQYETVYMCADINNVQVQLCQPSLRKTPKRKFLDAHGEGVFHLGFVVDDVDQAEAAGRAAGLAVFERGRRADGSGFTYFDTVKQAGVTLEIRANKREGVIHRDQPEKDPSRLAIFNTLHHVCLVAHDIRQKMSYFESLGIGPWQEYGSLTVYTELEVANRQAWLGSKYVFADLDNVQIQLCQPGPLKNLRGEFLEQQGEGVFHLGFLVKDCDAAEAAARNAGLAVLERGRRPDRSGFTYFATRPNAGVTLEIRSNKRS